MRMTLELAIAANEVPRERPLVLPAATTTAMAIADRIRGMRGGQQWVCHGGRAAATGTARSPGPREPLFQLSDDNDDRRVIGRTFLVEATV
ncbi:MAG TPA: hypothetical protein VN903_27175 [Polyangia bacterium]|jgi:hypothetical protein|nr:hypothetical protein [Polyangia bacterium]